MPNEELLMSDKPASVQAPEPAPTVGEGSPDRQPWVVPALQRHELKAAMNGGGAFIEDGIAATS